MKYYFSTILLLVFGVCFSQVKLQGYVKDSLGNGLELANVIAMRWRFKRQRQMSKRCRFINLGRLP
jgi:DNA primase